MQSYQSNIHIFKATNIAFPLPFYTFILLKIFGGKKYEKYWMLKQD